MSSSCTGVQAPSEAWGALHSGVHRAILPASALERSSSPNAASTHVTRNRLATQKMISNVQARPLAQHQCMDDVFIRCAHSVHEGEVISPCRARWRLAPEWEASVDFPWLPCCSNIALYVSLFWFPSWPEFLKCGLPLQRLHSLGPPISIFQQKTKKNKKRDNVGGRQEFTTGGPMRSNRLWRGRGQILGHL